MLHGAERLIRPTNFHYKYLLNETPPKNSMDNPYRPPSSFKEKPCNWTKWRAFLSAPSTYLTFANMILIGLAIYHFYQALELTTVNLSPLESSVDANILEKDASEFVSHSKYTSRYTICSAFVTLLTLYVKHQEKKKKNDP